LSVLMHLVYIVMFTRKYFAVRIIPIVETKTTFNKTGLILTVAVVRGGGGGGV
jgi:uncharacterized protein (UPF0210 family)